MLPGDGKRVNGATECIERHAKTRVGGTGCDTGTGAIGLPFWLPVSIEARCLTPKRVSGVRGCISHSGA